MFTSTDSREIEPPPHLSPRETEVLAKAARGMTNGEVAADLHVSIHAVKFHLASIYRKLGVTNRTEAAVRYLQSLEDAVPAHELSHEDAGSF
jgi:DNA-binding CsgD family transcriptional regulator